MLPNLLSAAKERDTAMAKRSELDEEIRELERPTGGYEPC